jgi:hypothetical protein
MKEIKTKTNSMRKENKTLSKKKVKRGGKKKLKKKEPKIKVPPHELLASTLSYLMLTPVNRYQININFMR